MTVSWSSLSVGASAGLLASRSLLSAFSRSSEETPCADATSLRVLPDFSCAFRSSALRPSASAVLSIAGGFGPR
jgi:hypothetical protein